MVYVWNKDTDKNAINKIAKKNKKKLNTKMTKQLTQNQNDGIEDAFETDNSVNELVIFFYQIVHEAH